ncbi:MAG: M23 family metallopeptidase [Deltaproteobacteria bacterium]|nr:M23 family metallopeptidase [Deltaproteobacteria bacterium]
MAHWSFKKANSKNIKHRHITLSDTKFRFISGFFAVFVVFSVIMTWGFFYYRAESDRNYTDAFVRMRQEKAELLSKVESLENSLNRIDRFAEKMEASVGSETGKLGVGIGPIDKKPEEDFTAFIAKVEKLPSVWETSEGHWKNQPLGARFFDKVSFKLDELQDLALDLELRVNDVYEANEDSLSFWASTPSQWPVHGWLTSGFGYRVSPWARRVKMHNGIDIAAAYGTPIKAPSDGVVSFAAHKGGYGRTIMIDHGFGIQTLYGHTSEVFVEEGDQVQKGQIIAAVGSSGASTGPHLHYEVQVDGVPTDPMSYIVE